MSAESNLVVHKGVALMLCDSEAILEETLLAMDTSTLHIKRIGDRAVVAPAYQLAEIREALQDRGTYPKLIGEIITEEELEAEDDEDDGEDGDEDEDEADDESAEDEEDED